ncbi:MAG TPA: hypothetical protein VF072_08740 [Thermoleophilaceae bacterium]
MSDEPTPPTCDRCGGALAEDALRGTCVDMEVREAVIEAGATVDAADLVEAIHDVERGIRDFVIEMTKGHT